MDFPFGNFFPTIFTLNNQKKIFFSRQRSRWGRRHFRHVQRRWSSVRRRRSHRTNVWRWKTATAQGRDNCSAIGRFIGRFVQRQNIEVAVDKKSHLQDVQRVISAMLMV